MADNIDHCTDLLCTVTGDHRCVAVDYIAID